MSRAALTIADHVAVDASGRVVLITDGQQDCVCCEATGACCLPAGGGCQQMTQAACQAAGGTWQGAGTSCTPDPCGSVCTPTGSRLIVCGSFVGASGLTVNNIAAVDGIGNFSALGAGFNGPVLCACVHQGELYVGGVFGLIHGHGGFPARAANNVARWACNHWEPVGAGLNAAVRALKSVGSSFAGGGLLAAGDFTEKVAAWNGIAWGAYPGANGSGHCLSHQDLRPWQSGVAGITDGGIGGAFTVPPRAGFLKDAMVNAFTGEVGVADGLNGHAFAALHYSNGLGQQPLSWVDVHVFGGAFTRAFGTGLGVASTTRMAKVYWNASRGWYERDTTIRGFNGIVHALHVGRSSRAMYAGGDFTASIGPAISCNRIARAFDEGATWSAMGSGFATGGVYAICEWGGRCYAGGNFSMTGVPQSHIAFFNGSSWQVLGSGTEGPVYALLEYDFPEFRSGVLV